MATTNNDIVSNTAPTAMTLTAPSAPVTAAAAGRRITQLVSQLHVAYLTGSAMNTALKLTQKLKELYVNSVLKSRNSI